MSAVLADIQQIPEVSRYNRRIETGVIQFGGDWPGVFIRGDECHYYRVILGFAVNALRGHAPKDKAIEVLEQFKDFLLSSCVDSK